MYFKIYENSDIYIKYVLFTLSKANIINKCNTYSNKKYIMQIYWISKWRYLNTQLYIYIERD